MLGWLLQATRCNHVYLPQVGGQKRKPQIDGTYKVKNLHKYRVKKMEATFHRISISYSLILNNW